MGRSKNWLNCKTSCAVPKFSVLPVLFWNDFLCAGASDAIDTNLLFSSPQVLDTPNKSTRGINPHFRRSLAIIFTVIASTGECEAPMEGKPISCDQFPDVLIGVNLFYDGLLRQKLFEYNFYWNSRKDWMRAAGCFDCGGKKYNVMNETPRETTQSMRALLS